MRLRSITLSEAEFIAHRLAFELMNSKKEPIPPFSTTDMHKLDSSLNAPFQTFGGKPLHRTFVERAAVLFYLVTKNHCFSNGNKRMAVTLTTVFCFINRRWLKIGPIDLYKLAKYVAESSPRERETVHKALVDLFNKHIEPIPSKYIIDRRRKTHNINNKES